MARTRQKKPQAKVRRSAATLQKKRREGFGAPAVREPGRQLTAMGLVPPVGEIYDVLRESDDDDDDDGNDDEITVRRFNNGEKVPPPPPPPFCCE